MLKLLADQWGIFQTEYFGQWLEKRLAARVEKTSGPSGEVVFRDISSMPLKIIVTDVRKRRIKLFSQVDTPEEAVSSAVAASISIPGFFVPSVVSNK
ncbi:MAG: patatin-like phospholipase family protein [Bryobacterales bacterium]